MKSRNIIYRNSDDTNCFLEYKGRNIMKALMFLKANDSLYIGLQTFCNDNRFEIQKNDSLYQYFLPLFKENRIIKA